MGDGGKGHRLDKSELVDRALAILVRIHPVLARVFYLYVVEEWTQEQLAADRGVNVKTIRDYINGRNDPKGGRVWGAREWMSELLEFLVEASRYDEFERIVTLFAARCVTLSDREAVVLLILAKHAARDGYLDQILPFLCCKISPRALSVLFDDAVRNGYWDRLLCYLRKAWELGKVLETLEFLLKIKEEGRIEKFFEERCPV